jgi:hypothetical protein
MYIYCIYNNYTVNVNTTCTRISVSYTYLRIGNVMTFSGVNYKRSRFHRKTHGVLFYRSSLIVRPKKAAVICVSSQGKRVGGL